MNSITFIIKPQTLRIRLHRHRMETPCQNEFGGEKRHHAVPALKAI